MQILWRLATRITILNLYDLSKLIKIVLYPKKNKINIFQVCSNEYDARTKSSMAALGESQLSFELIESLLHYIKSLGIPGGVLIFLPGKFISLCFSELACFKKKFRFILIVFVLSF